MTKRKTVFVFAPDFADMGNYNSPIDNTYRVTATSEKQAVKKLALKVGAPVEWVLNNYYFTKDKAVEVL